MPMSNAYLDLIANAGAAAITHVGLVDGGGVELAGGGYARQPCGWVSSGDGLSQLAADELFNIPAGTTVGGWRGYSALAAGVDYGGSALTPETFVNAGTYTLLAASTSIDHNAA